MPQCSAFGCTNRDIPGGRKKGLTFHRYPQRDTEKLRQWVANMKRGDWVPSERSHLCSQHFTSDCFDRTGQTVRLKESAVPTIFAFTKKKSIKRHLEEETAQQESKKRKRSRVTNEETDLWDPKKNSKNSRKKSLIKSNTTQSKIKRNGNIKNKKTVKKLDSSISTEADTDADDTETLNIKKEAGTYSDHAYSNEDELPQKRKRKPTYKMRIKQEQLSDEDEDYLGDFDADGEYVPEASVENFGNPEDYSSDGDDHEQSGNKSKKTKAKEAGKKATSDVKNVVVGKDKIIQLPDNRTYFEFAVPKKKVILQLKSPIEQTELQTQTLEELINTLKARQMISHNAQELLEGFGDLPEALLRCGTKIAKNLDKLQTEEVKKFATTLYLYAPKAYDLLNTVFLLPDKKSIQNRLQAKEFAPGFTVEALEILRNMIIKSPACKICSIMIESLNIKKQCILDSSSGKWIGHVDYCGGQNPFDSDGIPSASEILIFTAVGLRSDWKLPIGYFPLIRPSGEELHTLVCEAIQVLEDCGYDVRTLVCEGMTNTVSMGKIFGCNVHAKNFRELVTYFPHPFKPQQRLHLIFSIRQCFKLIRNLLSDKKVLRSSTYGIIKWRFFAKIFGEDPYTKLETLDIEAPEDIEFYHCLRIIRQCYPSFSCTLSQAFEFSEELKMKEYDGCDAASNFAADLYRAFDLLNSRSPVTTSEKPPITTPFLAEQLESLTVISQRLFGLELPSGKRALGEGRWMSVGLLAFTLKSVSMLACDLINEKSLLPFLATYRLNLDHSAMILSYIQRCQKWSDIPTVADFMKGYKKLFSVYGPEKYKIYKSDFEGEHLTIGQGVIYQYDAPVLIPDYESKSILHSFAYYNSYVEEKARCLIKQVSMSLSCTECMALLLDSDKSCELKKKKINIGHIRPSRFILRLLQISERVFQAKMLETRQMKDELLISFIYCEYFSLNEGLNNIGADHFMDEPHHAICLIKVIIRNFIHIKQFCMNAKVLSRKNSVFERPCNSLFTWNTFLI